MKIEEDGIAAPVTGSPNNQTVGVEGPLGPIKAKQKNLFKRVSDIKKKQMGLYAEAKVPLNKQ